LTLIGKMVGNVGGNEHILLNPRRVHIAPTNDPGRVTVHYLMLLGDPKELRLHQIAFTHDAAPELVRSYMEAITGLTLAKAVPAGLSAVHGGKNS
jgi:hypothetical protein